MYHRFNENKYPSTNIKMDIFKNHIEIIKINDFKFYDPIKFEEDFSKKNDCKYENIPKLCDKFNIKKNLINPIYLS